MLKQQAGRFCQLQSRPTHAGKAEPYTWHCHQRQPASRCPWHSQLRERSGNVPSGQKRAITMHLIHSSFIWEAATSKSHQTLILKKKKKMTRNIAAASKCTRHMKPSLKAPRIVKMSSEPTLCKNWCTFNSAGDTSCLHKSRYRHTVSKSTRTSTWFCWVCGAITQH